MLDILNSSQDFMISRFQELKVEHLQVFKISRIPLGYFSRNQDFKIELSSRIQEFKVSRTPLGHTQDFKNWTIQDFKVYFFQELKNTRFQESL